MVAAGTVGVIGLALPAAGLSPCTDSWVSPSAGSWDTPTDWSTGAVPSASDTACINVAGTYTVSLPASANVGAVEVGGGATGTQTLEIDAPTGSTTLNVSAASTISSKGKLVLAPTNNGYADIAGGGGLTVASGGALTAAGTISSAYIETALTNQAGGAVTLSVPTIQDEGTLTTNAGTFTVSSGASLSLTGSSSFKNTGALAVTGAMSQTSGTFTEAGGSESGNAVQLASTTLADSAGTGSFTFVGSGTLSGTIPVGQKVTVSGAVSSVQLTATGVTDRGTLLLAPGANGYADVVGSGPGLTIASGGLLSTAGTSNFAYFELPIINQSGGNINVATKTGQDEGTLTTNAGTTTIAAGASLALTGSSSFTNTSTLTVTGTMSEAGGTFSQTSGSESGSAVQLSSATLTDSAGTGQFTFVGSGTLTGTIPVGQKVTVSGAVASVQLVATGVTDRGTLVIAPGANGYADITGSGAGLTVAPGGLLSTTGSDFQAYIETAVVNQAGGTVNIAYPDTEQDEGTLTSNAGAFTVTGNLTLTGSSSFTNTGTLSVSGSMSEAGGTFTQTSGTETGHAVQLSSATLADTAGTGSFDFVGSGTVTGTIPVGQTVTASGASASVQLTATGVTDRGKLVLAPGAGGYADLVGGSAPLTVASGGVLSTAGTASSAYIELAITNQAGGTVSVGNPITLQDGGVLISNSGTLTVVNGGELVLSGSSTVTNASTATLGVTVNGTSGTGGMSGPGVTLAGKLAVTTVGSPAVGSTFTPISGPVTGAFSSFFFGPKRYIVSYPSSSVLLTTAAPFTVTASTVTAHKNIATGSIQVATIGSAANGTGTYSATVSWGDGSANSSATVAVTGSTGTVTAPTHTYANSGSFTLTTTVANTNGTTITVTKTVSVATIAVSGITPTSGSTSGDTTVTVTGTGFTGATAVKFGTIAATNYSVVSDTQITAVSPAQSGGAVDVLITTPGGTSAPVTADRFTYVVPPPAVTGVSPTSGPTAGGTTVTVTGTNFTGATEVKFGTVAATSFTVVSDTKITAVSPAEPAGAHNVLVTTASGTSAGVTADRFTFTAPAPAVTGVSPTSGPTAGGTTVTITGTSFTGATVVKFGTVSATSFTVLSDTKITAVSPPQAAAAHNVYVTTPGGTSEAVSADKFTYH